MHSKGWITGAAATAFVLSLGVVASAQQPPPPPPGAPPATVPDVTAGLTPTDQQFIIGAVRDNEREVELGELAKEKAQNPAVGDFAARMVRDHATTAKDLRRFAASKGLRVRETKMG